MKTPNLAFRAAFLLWLSTGISVHAADLHVPAEYASAQEAIDVSLPGDTIHIAAGDYYDQLLISNKTNLTLAGMPGATFHATASMTDTLQPYTGARAILGVFRSDNIVVTGIAFHGEQLGDIYSPAFLGGIFYLSSSGKVEGCRVRAFRGPTLREYSSARGLTGWNPARAAELNVGIINSTFEDNERSIVLAGSDRDQPSALRLRFTVEGNVITGFGPAEIAIDGITLYTGATGEIRGNVIRDHALTGVGDSYAAGISGYDGLARQRANGHAVPLKPIRIEGNTFINNDEHILLILANGTQVQNNNFHGGGSDPSRWGAVAFSGTNVVVADNNFSNVETGLVLFSNDHFFSGWPPIGTAANAQMVSNWFTNVTAAVWTNSAVSGLQEKGTELCCFEPRFQSMVLAENGKVKARVRTWHGQPLIVESSSDLKQWVPVSTTMVTLPMFEYEAPNGAAAGREFFRIRKDQ